MVPTLEVSKSGTSKSPKTVSYQKTSGAKSVQPVSLHIAIAPVKEAFPLRRAVKSLQSLETDSARYFKEQMRHPWISGQKFIFHVPVRFTNAVSVAAGCVRVENPKAHGSDDG